MVKRGRAEPREAKRARAAESERRARMFVHAHLAWLEGFPERTESGELRWWRLDGTAPLVVDAAMLSRARRAQKTLISDHADALDRVVGNVAHWGAAVDGVLAAIGHALRGAGTPQPPLAILPNATRRMIASVVAAHPALADVVDAAAMAMLARPPVLAATLRWIESRAQMLANLVTAEPGPRGIQAALRLAAFADEHGAPLVDPLLALASIDAPFPEPALQMARAIVTKLGNSSSPRPVPPKTTTSTIVDWIGRLAGADPAARKRALTLLDVVDLATPLVAIRDWWKRVTPPIQRALAVAAPVSLRPSGPSLDGRDGGTLDVEYLKSHIDTVNAIIKDGPVVFDLLAYLGVVEQTAWPGAGEYFKPIVRLLELVPTTMGALARMRLLDEWRDDGEVAGERKMAWLWDALADELEKGGVTPERLLAPWKAAVDGHGSCFAQPIRGSVFSKNDAKRVAEILARCAVRGQLNYALVDRAMAFVSTSIAPERVAEVIEAASGVTGYFDAPQVRAAVALGGDAVKELIAALEIVMKICDELPSRTAGEVAALVAHAREDGGVWVLRRILDEKKNRSIVDAAAIAAAIPKSRWPRLVKDTRGVRWLDAYPAGLRGALTRLGAADPEADVTARRILRRDLPHPDDAAKELAALRAGRHKSPSAAGRLKRLERGSRAPGAVRLARLSDRIERVAAQVAIDRFTATVTREVTGEIATACSLPAWPGWPLDRQRVAVFTALTKLPARARDLAMQLLRRRAGDKPWDLRDEPKNRAFLAGLRERDIDPAPWLDDVPRPITAADGTVLTVGFAGDPLDVFVMGEHFNTCLGADGVNFFSVVTNAADINKRVLYAHRPDGKVAGRCLFALTDGGRILTFEPYAHDGKLDFPRVVRDRALELAARMKTEVVGTGSVTTLLAEEWYDDGAHDLVERFPCLAHDAPLRSELATIEPAALVAKLPLVLAHALDDVTLPLVIAMPELLRRPELVIALGPALLAASAIPDATMITAARAALQGGNLALADRLLAGRARAQMMVDTPRWIGDLLARIRPSLALALLRSTRDRGVRGWENEPVERIVVAATAMETLRRPRQAAALYRIAIRRGWQALVDELKPRLAAIEARSA